MHVLIRTLFTAFFLLMVSTIANAQTKVVVIPLGGDGCDPCYARTIRVAPSGADFDHPVAAIESISKGEPDIDNKILIKVAAGNYTMAEPLYMLRNVDIEGAGVNQTILSGALSTSGGSPSNASIVIGAHDAELRNLSLVNTGGNCLVIGMYNPSSSPTVRGVSIEATGSQCVEFSGIFGIYNFGESASPKFYDVESSASAAHSGSFSSVQSFGIFNQGGAFSYSENSTFAGFAGNDAGKSVRVDSDSVGQFNGGRFQSDIFSPVGGIVRCRDVINAGDFDINIDCSDEAGSS